MTTTCFILDELYPADRGGIARLMHNIIHHAKAVDPTLDIHVVLARDKPIETALADSFENYATLHYFRPDKEIASSFGLANLNISSIFEKQSVPKLRELRVLDTVMQAAKSCGGFDHIEIPDHMGLGSIVLEAKRAGFAFQDVDITCRIHSTLSVILSAEPFYHARSDWLAPRLEMERFALGHADRVVSHLPTIARYNRTHFSFDTGWMDKVETEFPPVIWPAPSDPPKASPGKDFIFTSRLQPFKRPELFIKGAIVMLDSGSDFGGNFRLISYGFNPEYIDFLRLSIPARYRGRIFIQTNVSAADRLEAILQGIIVQPSNYESLCALAYEVSSENRPLLLATDCLAFSDNPLWKNEENCLFFNPDPESLATVMEQSRNWQPSSTVETVPEVAYFAKPPQAALPKQAMSVGLLIGPIHSSEELARVSAQVKSLRDVTTDIIAFGYAALTSSDTDIDYQAFSDGLFKSKQWRALAQSLEAKAIILCSADALPTVEFINQGAQVVCSGVAYSSNSRDETNKQLVLYPGKFGTIGIAEHRICPPCLILHQSDLTQIELTDDQDLITRLITRISQSELELRLSPAPLVREFAYKAAPPSQRQLGYDTAPLWQNGVRWIGVGVKPSVLGGLLENRPISLNLGKDPDQNCAAGQPIFLKTGEPQVFALSSDHAIENSILAISTSNEHAENAIKVSLHQGNPSDSIDLHKKGRNCQHLKGGQKYRMRWGPIWQAKHLTLVISSENPATIRLENPVLLSKN